MLYKKNESPPASAESSNQSTIVARASRFFSALKAWSWTGGTENQGANRDRAVSDGWEPVASVVNTDNQLKSPNGTTIQSPAPMPTARGKNPVLSKLARLLYSPTSSSPSPSPALTGSSPSLASADQPSLSNVIHSPLQMGAPANGANTPLDGQRELGSAQGSFSAERFLASSWGSSWQLFRQVQQSGEQNFRVSSPTPTAAPVPVDASWPKQETPCIITESKSSGLLSREECSNMKLSNILAIAKIYNPTLSKFPAAVNAVRRESLQSLQIHDKRTLLEHSGPSSSSSSSSSSGPSISPCGRALALFMVSACAEFGNLRSEIEALGMADQEYIKQMESWMLSPDNQGFINRAKHDLERMAQTVRAYFPTLIGKEATAAQLSEMCNHKKLIFDLKGVLHASQQDQVDELNIRLLLRHQVLSSSIFGALLGNLSLPSVQANLIAQATGTSAVSFLRNMVTAASSLIGANSGSAASNNFRDNNTGHDDAHNPPSSRSVSDNYCDALNSMSPSLEVRSRGDSTVFIERVSSPQTSHSGEPPQSPSGVVIGFDKRPSLPLMSSGRQSSTSSLFGSPFQTAAVPSIDAQNNPPLPSLLPSGSAPQASVKVSSGIPPSYPLHFSYRFPVRAQQVSSPGNVNSPPGPSVVNSDQKNTPVLALLSSNNPITATTSGNPIPVNDSQSSPNLVVTSPVSVLSALTSTVTTAQAPSAAPLEEPVKVTPGAQNPRPQSPVVSHNPSPAMPLLMVSTQTSASSPLISINAPLSLQSNNPIVVTAATSTTSASPVAPDPTTQASSVSVEESARIAPDAHTVQQRHALVASGNPSPAVPSLVATTRPSSATVSPPVPQSASVQTDSVSSSSSSSVASSTSQGGPVSITPPAINYTPLYQFFEDFRQAKSQEQTFRNMFEQKMTKGNKYDLSHISFSRWASQFKQMLSYKEFVRRFNSMGV